MKSRMITILGLVVIAASVAACSQVSTQTSAQYFAALESKPGPR